MRIAVLWVDKGRSLADTAVEFGVPQRCLNRHLLGEILNYLRQQSDLWVITKS